jgi:hypothetical protein
MIRKYDIICLVETKTDDIDIVKLEGYEIHMKNRKIVAIRPLKSPIRDIYL